jgi:hypothetical protein
MPGKRITGLTALSGAGSANNDDLVIFDATASETKRISRSQLAEGMQADVQVLSNKTITLGSNTVTGTTAQFNTALTDNNFATQAGSEVLTNKTIALTGNTVNYNQGGTGAITRTVQARLQDYVSVKDFGAVGDGVTNDTAAIQAAITSGKPIVFPAGNYASGPLTQSTNFQRFYANGQVSIIKNADGVLFTSSGTYVELDGIQFVGTGYTGDNINMSGSHPRLINCSSYGTPGRALKATGGHVQIIGTSGIYNTTDATASGYDIEIGVSGTATLYHQLIGVYTSQATGGILLTDTGSHVISGGQFGKLTIKAGTSPVGVNGGMTSNARILGDVTVEISNSRFTGNQFSTQTITFALGTSNHSLDSSNLTVSATIVNNGNKNSAIIKSIGTGSPDGVILQYGHDAGNSTIRYDNDEIYFQDSNLFLANNKALKFADSSGVYYGAVSLSNNDDWFFGANNGANFAIVNSGSGGVYVGVSAVSITQTTSSQFRPASDGTINLGGASNRWNTVYATTALINTSDQNEKQDIVALDAAELRVAVALKGMIKKYRFKDAVSLKGDDARTHVGVIAQEVVAAFAVEGLDAHHYGLLCYDVWEAEPAVVDEDGKVMSSARVAGSRFGIRYEELLAFIIAAL